MGHPAQVAAVGVDGVDVPVVVAVGGEGDTPLTLSDLRGERGNAVDYLIAKECGNKQRRACQERYRPPEANRGPGGASVLSGVSCVWHVLSNTSSQACSQDMGQEKHLKEPPQ